MEPKLIVLDVGNHLKDFRRWCSKAAPYLHDKPLDICKEVARCATNRVAPYDELLKYVAKFKHGQSFQMPPRESNMLSMAIGDLGMSLINSLERSRFHDLELEDDEYMPYHFHSAKHNIVVLEHNGQ